MTSQKQTDPMRSFFEWKNPTIQKILLHWMHRFTSSDNPTIQNWLAIWEAYMRQIIGEHRFNTMHFPKSTIQQWLDTHNQTPQRWLLVMQSYFVCQLCYQFYDTFQCHTFGMHFSRKTMNSLSRVPPANHIQDWIETIPLPPAIKPFITGYLMVLTLNDSVIQKDLEWLLKEAVRTNRLNPIGKQTEVTRWSEYYLHFFPKFVRHKLGEFYTPRWLVQKVLEPLSQHDSEELVTQSCLDPACGAGSFILEVVALKLNRWQSHPSLQKRYPLEYVLGTMVGYDLNPLALLVAWMQGNLLLLCLGHSSEPVPLSLNLRDMLLDQQPGDKHRFHWIVGNPPWLNWEQLDPAYRQRTIPLWKKHHLFPHSGMDTILGKGKKDLSMLVTAIAWDYYLKKEGTLHFVITRAIINTQGAGSGLRRFALPDETPIQISSVDDFTNLSPFEGTSIPVILLRATKNVSTKYPLPYNRWSRNPTESLFHANAEWKAIQNCCYVSSEEANPADTNDRTAPWIILPKELNTLPSLFLGTNPYRAYTGAYSGGANGIYWVHVTQVLDSGQIHITNLPPQPKLTIPTFSTTIESPLVYPLVRARDVSRWTFHYNTFILMVQDPNTRRGIAQVRFQDRYPLLYDFFSTFQSQLENRAAYRRYFTRTSRVGTIQPTAPFYSMFDVGLYTFSPFKVAWRRIASQLDACVLEPVKTDWGEEKPPIPQETISFIPTSTREEAIFLATILNSPWINFIVSCYSQVGGKSFGSPGVINQLRLPPFDHTNPNHLNLVEVGQEMVANNIHPASQTPDSSILEEQTADLLGLDAATCARILKKRV